MPTPTEQALLLAFELHDPQRVSDALRQGLDGSRPIDGKLPVTWLTEMYTRSDRLPDCLRLLLDAGATPASPALTAVLLDDPAALRTALADEPAALTAPVDLHCAFTPLESASLLHVACEYGNLRAAEALLAAGAAVDARAAVDTDGLNGHTPLFHTVNSHANRSAPLMELLLAAGADPALALPGIVWGRGFDWETVCLDVTPLSYAQLGLLPQMHRREADVYATIGRLMAAAGRRMPALRNVPNRYLQP